MTNDKIQITNKAQSTNDKVHIFVIGYLMFVIQLSFEFCHLSFSMEHYARS